MATVKPSELSAALDILIAAQQPVNVIGMPGVGKSNIIGQTATRHNLALIDCRAVLLDPVDLRGLPHVNGGGRAHWAIPEFLPRSGAGIFFLDELNRAPALVQNACFQLILDRRIGEYVLPPDWTVIAAGNRESDGGGVTRMNSALANRFVHLELEPDVDDWCKWAVLHLEPEVIAFIRFKPDLLCAFDRNSKAYPTPRSWEFISRITARKPNPAIEHALFAGTVGDGAAIEYSAFLRLYRSLPSIDAILLAPATAPIPKEPATLYAVASALARRAKDTNFAQVTTYLNRLPAEYAVMSIVDAVRRDATLQTTKEFTRWAVENSAVVF